jgi:hypothetical protein
MTSHAPRIALATALLLAATTAVAQREGTSYLSYVGPEVSLVSHAEDDSAARPNTPILAGDRIATGTGSRVEAILADGNVLRIDVRTSLRFDRLARTYEADDDRNAIYLERGAVSLEHRWPTSREQATRIDTDDATILFPDEGRLRVETGRRGTEVYVASGRAEVYARSGRTTLRAGQYAFAAGEASLEVDWLEEPRDGFSRFVAERRDLAAGQTAPGYVSPEYGYDYAAADFDRYGSWILVDGSYAWRPSVGPDWQPYVDGYWRWSPAGLTWVSYEPWGWLPYHYGSWYWDVGFGWYWSPGTIYSPAWVYWSYTPSWVGWCPIGYYGGYYGGWGGGHHGGGHPDPYARSHRKGSGAERGTHAYPHLRGRVDVTRVDPRGWSYTSVSRLGTRLDSRRDILRQENVGFRPGERGLVATTPLRIDRARGGSVTTAVQDAVRRVPATFGGGTAGDRAIDDITPVLRRDGTLGTAAREGLRRSLVTPGQDPGYRPVPADQIAAPRRDVAGGASSGLPSRGGDRGAGSSSAPVRSTETTAPGRSAGSEAPREAWRGGGRAPAPGGGRAVETTPRRSGEPILEGGFGQAPNVRGDDGWRSPGGGDRSGTPSRTFDVPSRGSTTVPEKGTTPVRAGSREAAPDVEPWRAGTSPSTTRKEAPAAPAIGASSPAGREVPAPRGDGGWRGAETPSRSYEAPRAAPAPRSEAPPSRSYGTPSRSYEAPRSAPAPRSEAPPSRSYSTSPRSADAPRSAPAPRSEAPSRSSGAPSSSQSAPPSRSSAPPPSSSGGTSSLSASPRG